MIITLIVAGGRRYSCTASLSRPSQSSGTPRCCTSSPLISDVSAKFCGPHSVQQQHLQRCHCDENVAGGWGRFWGKSRHDPRKSSPCGAGTDTRYHSGAMFVIVLGCDKGVIVLSCDHTWLAARAGLGWETCFVACMQMMQACFVSAQLFLSS